MADKKIKIIKNGPYFVTGGVPLEEKIIAYDQNGYYYEESKVYEHRDSYALCRCGKSSDKPFCDGTHASIDFDGTTRDNKKAYEDEVIRYENENLILKDNEKLCAFARFCHSKNSEVWTLMSGNMTKEEEKLAVKLACDCPAGRLVMFDKKTEKNIEPTYEQSIVLLKDPMRDCDGAIWVRGGIPIEDENGYVFEIRNRVTLCRCGKSFNKPFCDASHI